MGATSDSVTLKLGIRQGCVFSPISFNIFPWKIFHQHESFGSNTTSFLFNFMWELLEYVSPSARHKIIPIFSTLHDLKGTQYSVLNLPRSFIINTSHNSFQFSLLCSNIQFSARHLVQHNTLDIFLLFRNHITIFCVLDNFVVFPSSFFEWTPSSTQCMLIL